MTYEERTRQIFAFLFDQSGGLLRRYTKPEHLSEDRARDEINDMVEDINSEIPANIGEASLGVLLGNMRKHVRRRHGARSWPTIKILLAAVADAAAEVDKINDGGTDVEARMVSALIKWYAKHGDCMPSCGSAARTRAMVEMGVLTAREARHAGFPMDAELMDQASQDPQCSAEREAHIRASARLWGCSEPEAESRMQGQGMLPPDDVPHRLRDLVS